MSRMVFITLFLIFCNKSFSVLINSTSPKMVRLACDWSDNKRQRMFGFNPIPVHLERMRRMKPIEWPHVTSLSCRKVPCTVGGASDKKLFELQGGDPELPKPRFMLKAEQSGGVKNELFVSKLAQETGLSGQYAVVNPHDHNGVAIFMIPHSQSLSKAFKGVDKEPKFLFPKSPRITSEAYDGRWSAVRDGIFTELAQITDQLVDGQKFNVKSFYDAMVLKVFVACQDIRPDNLVIDNFETVYAIDNALWRHSNDLQDAERIKPLEITDDRMCARVRYFHTRLRRLTDLHTAAQLFDIHRNVCAPIESVDADEWVDVPGAKYVPAAFDPEYVSIKPEGLQHFEKLLERARRILEDLDKSLKAYDAKCIENEENETIPGPQKAVLKSA